MKPDIKKIFRVLPLAGIIFAACNDIDSDERLIPLPPVESDRVILLEDYTGQRCTNCPDAHQIIEQLQAQYPGQVVAVSIHAGSFAVPVTNPTYLGLKQPFGDEMGSFRNIEEYPSGIIDGNGPMLHTAWAAAVYNALQVPSLCQISVDGLTFDAASRTLSGFINILPGTSTTANLGIWLLEDGIVARQTEHGTVVREYVHNHVMRTYISTTVWGDPVTLLREEETEIPFSVAVASEWDETQLSIVAFATDATTGQYLQTAIGHVSAENAAE